MARDRVKNRQKEFVKYATKLVNSKRKILIDKRFIEPAPVAILIFKCQILFSSLLVLNLKQPQSGNRRRHTQHNDTSRNDTQHNDKKCDVQRVEPRYLNVDMVSVASKPFILSVILLLIWLNVVAPKISS